MSGIVNKITFKLPDYGAVELKKQIKRNTLKGFTFSFSAMLIIFCFYLFTPKTTIGNNDGKKPPVKPPDFLPPEIFDDQTPEISNINNKKIIYGTKEIAGKLIPIPDIRLVEEDIASWARIDKSSSKPVVPDSSEIFGAPLIIDDKISIETNTAPQNDETVEFAEVMPNVDLNDIRKNLKYPEIARRIGIGGKVIVRVLVGKNGDVLHTEISYTDSEYLNNAALDAVKKAAFTPARQNTYPVSCWVSVPIEFKLRN